MSMRVVGQHPITETLLGVVIAMLTVASIGLGFFAGFRDARRYLRMRRF
jgi:hypothetical protein